MKDEACIIEIKDYKDGYERPTKRHTSGTKTGNVMYDATGQLAYVQVAFTRWVPKLIEQFLFNKVTFVAEQVIEDVPADKVFGVVDTTKAPEPKGKVVITTDHKGRCVAVTRQADDGLILSTIWMYVKKE